MKILTVRRGFLADHSSTSYEFLAVDRPLDKKARAAVASLSSRAAPSARKVSFVYHADGYDIPGGWQPLMREHYDVMYSESYDWWTLAVAFDTRSKALVDELTRYAFLGGEDLGVVGDHDGRRMLVTVHCRLDPMALMPDDGMGGLDTDALLDLLVRLRDCLKQGRCEPLWAVWQVYGYNDDKAPPRPRATDQGQAVADELEGMLDCV